MMTSTTTGTIENRSKEWWTRCPVERGSISGYCYRRGGPTVKVGSTQGRWGFAGNV